MLFKALNILKSELSLYLAPHLKDGESVVLDNIAMLEANSNSGNGNNPLSGKVVISLVSVQQEKTLRNLPNFRIEDGKTVYKNAPVHLNLFILISANSDKYETSLKHLSQIIKFFQGKNIFTHLDSFEQVNDPEINQLDQEAFKLVVDLHSTSFEEANYLWSTLGGKQLPSVCYKVRVVALERDLTHGTSGTITEIQINES